MTISCDTNDTACTVRAGQVANWTKTYHEERDKYIRAYRNYLEKALKGETATTEKGTMQTAHDAITLHLKDLSDNNELNSQTLSDRLMKFFSFQKNVFKEIILLLRIKIIIFTN